MGSVYPIGPQFHQSGISAVVTKITRVDPPTDSAYIQDSCICIVELKWNRAYDGYKPNEPT